VEKQPAAEREKFQPSYESTVLAEVGPGPGTPPVRRGHPRDPAPITPHPPPQCPPWPDALGAPHSPPGTPGAPQEGLGPCASPLETQQWLLRRRFSSCARVFANFTGADLLKLSRRDLIQICGAPDGIRLCHALAGR
uniref:Uncharacterized protein n=1 Tax=Geospiza parvula TaxID=87175 RepID=A0A8U8BP33_GEOPR